MALRPPHSLAAELAAAGARLVVLFGSRARGTHRPDSDFDLGVVGISGLELLGHAARLGAAAGVRVDLVDLGKASTLLAYAVAREGRCLHDADGSAWPAFVSLAVRRHSDTAGLRALQAEALRRLAAGAEGFSR
jgi:predicted nucleotidyltransferase